MILSYFRNFSTLDFITTVLGVFGILTSILSFQCKKHNRLMFLKTASEGLFAVQYCLLGAYTGMMMNIIGCIRNLLFAKWVQRQKSTKIPRLVFGILFVLFSVVTWAGFKSALSGFAKVLSTVAYGSANTGFVRIVIFITGICWLIYNYKVGSYTGCICELLTICSIIVGILRIDLPAYREKTAAKKRG